MRKLSVILLSVLMVLCSLGLFGQETTAVPARIYIHVDSASGGASVPGANVTLLNTAVGTKLNGLTDSNGDLTFDVDVGTLFNPSDPDLSFSFAHYNQTIRATAEQDGYESNSKSFVFEEGQIGIVKGWVNITLQPEEVNDTPILVYATYAAGITIILIIILLIFLPKKDNKKDKKR